MELYIRSEKLITTKEKKKRIITQLQNEKDKLLPTNANLQNEVALLSFVGL